MLTPQIQELILTTTDPEEAKRLLGQTWDLDALRALWQRANDAGNNQRAAQISFRMDLIRGS